MNAYEDPKPLLTVSFPDRPTCGVGWAHARMANLIAEVKKAGLFKPGAVYGHRDLGLHEDSWLEQVHTIDGGAGAVWFRCREDGDVDVLQERPASSDSAARP